MNQKALEWVTSGDTGTSSLTIWAVMMGAVGEENRYDHPYDPSDLGRCLRLLEKAPEWRERMDEVSQRFPDWAPLVENWEKLEELYYAEKAENTGRAPRLYHYMKHLLEPDRYPTATPPEPAQKAPAGRRMGAASETATDKEGRAKGAKSAAKRAGKAAADGR